IVPRIGSCSAWALRTHTGSGRSPIVLLREWAWLHYLTRFAITLHRALKFYRRMSLVCAALDTAKFEQQYGIRLLQRSGSGHGPTATFTFSVHSAGERNPGSPLLGGEHDMGTT